MSPKVLKDFTANDALNLMQRVSICAEESRDVPIVLAEAGTCYAFCSSEDVNRKNDWRADGYRWRHNGRSCIKVDDNVVIRRTYYNVYTASKKTSSSFRRISHECDLYPDIVIVYYCGDHTIAGRYPHGNRRCDSKPFVRTCPSIIAACRDAEGEPSTIFNSMASSIHDNPEPSVESLISTPRDALQISNQKKYAKRKEQVARSLVKSLHQMTCDDDYIYEIVAGFDLIVAAYQMRRLKEFNHLLQKLPQSDAQFITLIPVYKVSNLTVSIVRYKHTMDSQFSTLFFVIHNQGIHLSHEALWEISCRRMPNFTHLKNVCIMTDDENQQQLPTESLLGVTVETFSDIISRLIKWKENPIDAVRALQNNAGKLNCLANYYKTKCQHSKAKRKSGRVTQNLPTCSRMFSITDGECIQLVTSQQRLSDIPQTSLGNIEPVDTDNDNGSCTTSLAMEALGTKALQYFPETGSFLVKGGNDVRVVKLFPEEICTCPSSSPCSHILACKYFIGQSLPPSEIIIHLNDGLRKETVSDLVPPTSTSLHSGDVAPTSQCKVSHKKVKIIVEVSTTKKNES